jgi:hypothetical protein
MAKEFFCQRPNLFVEQAEISSSDLATLLLVVGWSL